jgi:uncharacterized protein (TIGR02145 family)
MKSLLYIAAAVLMAGALPAQARTIKIYTFNGKHSRTPPPPPPAPVVDTNEMQLGSVAWASVNVDGFRTFAEKPDTLTAFYQFNRKTAYSATDPLTPSWDTSKSFEDGGWTAENDPCPTGWRLPAWEEYEQLINVGHSYAEKNTRGNAVAGMFFGANAATCSIGGSMSGCVFLPALCCRVDNGVLNKGSYGNYWSTTQRFVPQSVYTLYFMSHNLIMPPGFGGSANKWGGCSIRCVRDL